VGKIDPEAYRQRIERLTAIFSDVVRHADRQALTRCPYKNRFDRCTAGFGCRHRRPSKEGLPHCSSDDRLDYRSAWEAAPEEEVERMRARLRREERESEDR